MRMQCNKIHFLGENSMKIPDFIKTMRLIPLTDYTKIAREKWANDNIFTFDESWISYGVDTERSDLVVIDCDNKNGHKGIENFFDLYQENDDTFPDTYSVETPHGTHFYFKAPSDKIVRSSVGKLCDGVDVRAKGGYVVGPGSLVKDEDGSVKEYRSEDDAYPIKEMPEWLINKLLVDKTPVNTEITSSSTRQKKKTTVNKSKGSGENEIEKIDTLNWALEKMSNAHEGVRQTYLNHTSYFAGVKRVNKKDAYKLVDIAITKGLEKTEAERTFSRAYEDGTLETEIPPLTAITKEFNTKTSTSFKEDPLDSEFYGHVSLSYNFWKKFRNNLLFWQADGKWYSYDEKRGFWQKIDDDVLRDLLKNFLEKLVLDIRSKNAKVPTSIYREQTKLWQKSTLEAVMTIARSDFLNTNPDLFDANPLLINCANGVVDLKTKTIMPHSKDLFIRNTIPFNYNPEAKDPYCDKVIECISPTEKDFLQIMAGQALTGEQPRSQVAIFLQGGGSNGKSTFVDLMLRTSGTYGKLQTPNVLQPEQNKEIYALSDFEGLRMAIIEELPDSKQLNSGALKRLVGTSRINSRRIYSENHDFENNSTIFVSCNKLPNVTDTDSGTWRRLLVVSFPFFFKKKASDIVGPFDRMADNMVIYAAQRKQSTAEAFLAWRIEGAYQWANKKTIENKVPESVSNSVQKWNESNDIILSWFNKNIEFDSKSYVLTLDLNDSFNNWLTFTGRDMISSRNFLEMFRNHPLFVEKHLTYKSNTRPLKAFEQSIYTNKETGEQRIVTNRGSFVQGIKFKYKTDNLNEEIDEGEDEQKENIS